MQTGSHHSKQNITLGPYKSSMLYSKNWAIFVPMANEEKDFRAFIDALNFVINELNPAQVYFIVDTISKDHTLSLCRELSAMDQRYVTVWSPESKNVVDAYLKGMKVAYEAGNELIIEMDAGLSHDPRTIPMFLKVLNEGYECAFGSRFIHGGSMGNSPFKRRFLSKMGTTLSNLLLGTKLHDMTSGYQGFHRNAVAKIIQYKFKSTGHFYQTELRYLLRKHKIFEVPIHYQAPSPNVSQKSIANSFQTLAYYFFRRITGRSVEL